MRVVIDTNVIVSALLSPEGTPARVLAAWQQEAFELLVSEPILSEYQRALSEERVRVGHKMTEEEIAKVVEGFRTFGILVEPNDNLQIIRDDPDDNKFLDCAIAGEATYIVSGDSHLLDLKEHQGIQILNPAMFLAANFGE